MNARTTIDRIDVAPDGVVHVRLLKGDFKYHRTTIPPGANVERQIAAVNKHLSDMGAGECLDAEWGSVRRVVAQEHTPEAAVAYREKMEARKRDVSDTGR